MAYESLISRPMEEIQWFYDNFKGVAGLLCQRNFENKTVNGVVYAQICWLGEGHMGACETVLVKDPNKTEL